MNHQPDISNRLENAIQWAKEAGEMLLSIQGRVGGIEEKGAVDLVSDADRRAQALILEGIERFAPEDGYLFEEDTCERHSSSGYMWVVDPLDGTTNYLHGSRHYAVSIGLQKDEERVGGIIYAPALGELFYGERGKGVVLNGKPVRVSDRARVQESLLATGFPYDRRERLAPLLDEWRRALLLCRGMRRAGAAALDFAYVACGRLDGYWEHGLSPWDVCAGLFLVEEAGGRVSNERGEGPSLKDSPLVASNGLIHEALLGEILLIGAGE